MHGSIGSGRSSRLLSLSGSQALALSTMLINLLRIVSSVCVTRLLSPGVYGITGLIVSVFYVINLLTDVGFQAYVVRHDRGDDPDFLSSVWTIHAGRGMMLAAIGMVLAWPLSLILGKPQLAAPLAVASLTFAIDGHASLNTFRGLRHGLVQRFAMLDLAVGITQTAAAIAAAYFMRNVWAIIASMLVASLVRVALSYRIFPGGRHAFRPDRDVAGDLWRFSRAIAASSALTLVITQIDKLAMSRILSLSQFGTYVIAASLAAAPTVFAFNYAATIVYPAAAAAWRDGSSVRDAYYRCWGRFFYAYAFGGGGLIAGAGLLIRLLYDPRYISAARYLSILAVSTAVFMLTRSMEATLVASGRTRTGVEANLTRLTWLIIGTVAAVFRNDAMTFVLTIGLIEIPAYGYSAWRMHRLQVIQWRRELSLFLTFAAGFAVGTLVSLLARLIMPSV
jgi:O-antigen/teichoic acid export membrane protein